MCTSLLWLCAFLTRSYLLPTLAPRTYETMSEQRRRKAVGATIRTMSRFALCLVMQKDNNNNDNRKGSLKVLCMGRGRGGASASGRRKEW